MTTNEQPTLFEPETKPTKKRGISDVGRSWRTPYKHGIMNKLMGREIGAANNIAAIHNMWLLDLSAGDGSVPEGLDWHFVDVAWFRIDRTRYEDIKGQLFLTKKERGA